MDKGEIKDLYSMKDILERCGFPMPNRAGFIRCPFHEGDREPSMKVYERDYHCFACGANGDIFTFIQELYHLSFKETFLMLGGNYEKPSFSSRLAIYKAEKGREMRRKEALRRKEKKRLNNHLINVYREGVRRAEPLSDAWCDCYNALQMALYHQEILEGEREEERGHEAIDGI